MRTSIYISILLFQHFLSYAQAPELLHPFSVSNISRISAQIKPPSLSPPEISGLITNTIISCLNHACGALAVQFLSFQAERISNSEVKVSWRTTNEVNNKMFIIERSTESTNTFIEEGRVDADKVLNAIHEYTFRDENDYENISYYRLRQIDLDNKFLYSRVVPVKGYAMEESIAVFPNPANSFTSLNIHLRNNNKGIVLLFNNEGQKVHQQNCLFKKGNNIIALDLSKFGKGFYIIKVSKSDGQTLTTKFIRN